MSYKGKKISGVKESKEGYDIWAAEYDKSTRFLDSFEKDKLKIAIGDVKGQKVLDRGCGTGRLIPELKKREGIVTGVDISEKMVEIAKKKFPNIEFVVGDSENLPFKDGSFDVVIAAFLIVHLKDLAKAFEEIYRVLRDGGKFILTNINQKKAPKLKLSSKEKIVINSHYHMPKQVIDALRNVFFDIEKEEFVYEKNIWVNQIIRAVK